MVLVFDGDSASWLITEVVGGDDAIDAYGVSYFETQAKDLSHYGGKWMQGTFFGVVHST